MSLNVWFTGLRAKLLTLVVSPSLVIGMGLFLVNNELIQIEKNLETANMVRLPLAQYAGEWAAPRTLDS